MLETLTIRHIALIDEVTIRFHSGLLVLTGETGAGKSIVVDAVNLILGGRAERSLIRTGCEKASVEAVFNARGNEKVKAFLDQESIDYDGETVIVYREISIGGKNICRVCGVVLPLTKLRELTSTLLDLHGQSEHQFLTDTDVQLQFLDQTGGNEHGRLLTEVCEDCNLFLENHRAYAKLVRQNETRQARMSALEKDLAELHRANLLPGEESALREEKKKLQIAEKESARIRGAYESMTAGEAGTSALARTKSALEMLKGFSEPDQRQQELIGRCESMYFEMEEIAYELSLMVDQFESDPERLEKVEERLDMIRRLERKYNLSADELSQAVLSMEKEYEQLCGMDDEISRLAGDHKRLLSQYRKAAGELSESRHLLAKIFEDRMMAELHELGMGKTQFSVHFSPNETGKPLMPTEKGDDRIEFLISPNPGEELKPLAKIASGGELSRLMLAVKTLEADRTGVESMVFDEIDTGISGRMAQVVAEKMISISGKRQVICVTHLPQLAAAADYQYLVTKTVSGERTNTSVRELDHSGRILEIARMISGAGGINEDSTVHASGLLSAAEKIRKREL